MDSLALNGFKGLLDCITCIHWPNKPIFVVLGLFVLFGFQVGCACAWRPVPAVHCYSSWVGQTTVLATP